jgi:hypothetical protein
MKLRQITGGLSLLTATAALFCATAPTHAADPNRPSTADGAADSQEALAKASQNPVANMISLPLQNNFNFGIGPNDVMQYNLNIQPVIPIHLNEDWNLITRTIIPIIDQPAPAPGVRSASGLGDINPQIYLSPAKPDGLIWGVGPTFTLPTATNSMLGADKWSMGPAVVALTIQGHWVIGAVANQQWSVGGGGDENVSAFLVQPFINYNMKHGWYLVTAPVITSNWEADSDDRWTVPVGGGVGKIFKIGKQAFNAQIQAFYNVEKPEFGSDWGLRFQIQLLFPEKHKHADPEPSSYRK